MKPEIFIRTDSNPHIGLGHLVRCIALTQMLRNDFTVIFFCRQLPANVIDILQANQIQPFAIGDEGEFIEKLNADTLVVLDGYHFDSNYQRMIKAQGSMLVCIDDMHDRQFFADLIINPVPGVTPQNYLAAIHTQFALGPDYALLRHAFLEQARTVRTIKEITSVIICFGGSDPNNLTERALKVVMQYPVFKKIVVVLGPMFNDRNGLNSLAENDVRVTVYNNVASDSMLELFLTVELAIVPSSGILLEAIAAGNCIISGMYVDNQRFVYESFRTHESFRDAGSFSTEEMVLALDSAIRDPVNNKKIIDGYSGERILKKFQQLAVSKALTIRKANDKDSVVSFGWATNPAIRAFSFQRSSIRWDEHLKWFQGKLSDPNCFYYVAELNQDVIGSVRFDIYNEEAVISYLVDPQFHSKGFGLLILSKAFQRLVSDLSSKCLNVKRLVGFVVSDNYASIRTFLNLGFNEHMDEGKLKFVKSVYEPVNKN
jgi:UDP-2,4-diacetamido-2,4,6-trideoxy-beta-L-altropyranose hydrolase